jgi:hypothetical protein
MNYLLRSVIFRATAVGLFILILTVGGRAQNAPGGGASPANCQCCCAVPTTITCWNPDRYGQIVQPQEVIFDFKTKLIAFPKDFWHLKRGDAIQVKVVNFNPFLYQVNINGTDSNYSAVVDNNNLLSAFTSLSNITSLVQGLSAGTGTAAASSSPQNGNEGVSVVELREQRKQPSPKKDPATQPYPKQLELESLFKKHSDGIGVFGSNFRLVQSTINETFYQWDHFFAPQRHLYPTCEEFASISKASDSIHQRFQTIQGMVTDLYNSIGTSQRNYLDTVSKFFDGIRTPSSNFSQNRFQDSLIRTYYQTALKTITVCDSILSYRVLSATEESIDRMQDVQPCYTSGPIFLTGDSKVVTLSFTPWSDSIHLPTYPNTTFELPWTQRMIWGVSAGIYGATLKSPSYAVQPSDTTVGAPVKIVPEKRGNAEFGIDALAYLAWHLNPDRYQQYNYLGFSFGAAMSVEASPKPRVMLGLTYVNGRNNRLVITLGAIAGAAPTLSNLYTNLSASYSASAPPTSITVNQVKAGAFLSLNYSFISH